MVKKLWKATCRTEKENLDTLMSGMIETLDLFEKDSLNSYLLQKSAHEQEKMESKIGNMESKLKELEEHLGKRY